MNKYNPVVTVTAEAPRNPIAASRPADLAVSLILLASRPDRINACLRSIAEADAPRPSEIIIVCNGTLIFSRDELAAWKTRLTELSALDLLPSSLGAARNAGVRAASRPCLLFLDDDTLIPRHFFRVLEEKLDKYPNAAVLGGPNRTPAMSSLFQRLVGEVLSSAFGAGPMRRRYTGLAGDSTANENSLMLCNLAIRRSHMERDDKWFPEDMERNEENLILDSLSARGKQMVHCPDLFVQHERRSNLWAFARQCYLSGVGRSQMARKRPQSLRTVHAAPLVPLLAALTAPLTPAPSLAILCAYAAAAAAVSFHLSAKFPSARGKSFFTLCSLFPTGHFSYAFGLLQGRRHS